MTNPLVSILMPVYNGEKYLQEAINSVLSQTYPYWELIIVNDGSTDSSRDIIHSYADERIRYFENEQNAGIAVTRNKALSVAQGLYCAVLDSDDIAHPERLSKQIKFLKQHHDYGMCGTWARSIDKSIYYNFPTKNEVLKVSLLFQCPFIHSSVMMRTRLLKQLQYDTNFPVAQDYDLWVRMATLTKMANIPESLTVYRIHSGNVSHSMHEKQNACKQEIFKRQLASMNIIPNEKELHTHELLANVKQASQILNIHFLKELKDWMYKLYVANKIHKSYDKRTLLSVLWFRWVLACLFMHKPLHIPCSGLPVKFCALLQTIQLLVEKRKTCG